MKRGSYNPVEVEKQIGEFWENAGIFGKYKSHRNGEKKYYFLDGPPYATGSIHLGTAMNKVLKDFFIRFFSMAGYDVSMQPGYDTHGLPIENKVEKQLGFRKKEDIEKFGIDKFNEECRKFATGFIGIMNAQFKNLAVWMDWSNPYLTLDKTYIEGAWYTFKKAFEHNLLYKGNYPIHVCPHCETVVAYNEIEHRTVKQNSIYVKFKIKGKNEYLLAWTTTPWTIPCNTGIMVNPDADYVRVKAGNDVLILAKGLLEKTMAAGKVNYYEILGEFKGSELVGTKYGHSLDEGMPMRKGIEGVVVHSKQYVTMQDGTGIVHLAPGCGKEDYVVGTKFNLPSLSPLTMAGKFKQEAGWLENIFAKTAEKEIIRRLESNGSLFAIEEISHEYPKCWRCDTDLLFIAVPQWFFRVSAIREKLIEENKKVNWVPPFASDNFESWLTALSDWPISRQRYWGIPLPIWVCESCGKTRVIGSSAELGVNIDDLHRPYIDAVLLDCDCGGKMKRIPDVLDVWFDSGVASWASIGFPGNKKTFEEKWPADLNIEGPDQFRGWWNSQIITSVITFGSRPFSNVILHGKVLDLKGAKMSKSKGNIITPEQVIEKYGRDALRLYLLGLPAGEDFSFSMDSIKESMNILNTLWNSFLFLETYCGRVDKPPKSEFEDRWIMSRINSVIDSSFKSNSNYNVAESARVIKDFVLKDLSRWYIRLIRDRTWPAYDGEDKNAAFYTMHYVFERLAKIIAPICPYIAEVMHKSLYHDKESVHLEDWPHADTAMINNEIEASMDVAREVVEAINALRQENGIRLRWPLNKAVIKCETNISASKSVIERASNVKAVVFNESPEANMVSKDFAEGSVALDVKMDASLMEESMIMELIRKVQTMRKDKRLDVSENIILFVKSDNNTEKSVKKWEDIVKKSVGAKGIEYAEHGNAETMGFEAVKIVVGFDVAKA
ncbi:MAG: isoleucine--tRNA ligase [Candidatus Aenigmatarchaeota archaeon]